MERREVSIYQSLPAPSDDEHEESCARWNKSKVPGLWMISESPCDCGQPDAPMVYQGSHITPIGEDRRGGNIDVAMIQSHDEKPWPYLRLSVNEGEVVLTRRNVQQIADTLNDWLQATA